ncbi:MAG: transketolase C-terminal domain-containing protein [Rectinemataceae bacterium]|nr:transketolase C-terminal domain-containing protein [Rectinemataceae bacterium]
MNLNPTNTPTRKAFSTRMAGRGEGSDFAVFESDIGYSTYSYLFGDKYPERYFNFGIAEVSTMSAAAGMASSGRNVVICGYGVFLTMRALEMVRSFVCYPNLNVKILSSHGGVTAAIDGVTHQATEDIAFMTTLPNMKVLCPCDPVSAAAAFDLALATPGPVFVRLMRDPLYELYKPGDEFRLGGSHVARNGSHVTIATYGDMVFQALAAADTLALEGIEAEVIDLYSIKPLDIEGILASAGRTGALLVAENHQSRNGVGSFVGDYLARNAVCVPYDHIGLEDSFAESGDYQGVLDAWGLGHANIASVARTLHGRKTLDKGERKA